MPLLRAVDLSRSRAVPSEPLARPSSVSRMKLDCSDGQSSAAWLPRYTAVTHRRSRRWQPGTPAGAEGEPEAQLRHEQGIATEGVERQRASFLGCRGRTGPLGAAIAACWPWDARQKDAQEPRPADRSCACTTNSSLRLSRRHPTTFAPKPRASLGSLSYWGTATRRGCQPATDSLSAARAASPSSAKSIT